MMVRRNSSATNPESWRSGAPPVRWYERSTVRIELPEPAQANLDLEIVQGLGDWKPSFARSSAASSCSRLQVNSRVTMSASSAASCDVPTAAAARRKASAGVPRALNSRSVPVRTRMARAYMRPVRSSQPSRHAYRRAYERLRRPGGPESELSQAKLPTHRRPRPGSGSGVGKFLWSAQQGEPRLLIVGAAAIPRVLIRSRPWTQKFRTF
jgi:hypothetical protein